MIGFVLMLVVLGFIGGFLSGLIGVGGGIVMIPLLLAVPTILGFDALSLKTITGITTLQVLLGATSGFYVHRKNKFVNKKLILWMGVPIVISSFLGAIMSKIMSEAFIYGMFAVLTLQAAIIMFLPKKEDSEQEIPSMGFNKKLAFSLASLIGILSGILGIGGGFLLNPVMIFVLGIPIRVTVGTSLAIAFLSSAAGFIGKWSTGQVPITIAVVLALSTVVGATMGSNMSLKLPTKALKVIMAVLFTLIALRSWINLLDFLLLYQVIELFVASMIFSGIYLSIYFRKQSSRTSQAQS